MPDGPDHGLLASLDDSEQGRVLCSISLLSLTEGIIQRLLSHGSKAFEANPTSFY
jgi:hypothetical protein